MPAVELVLLDMVLLFASFVALGEVTERHFVPALNLLCERWRVPDDVAGATIMAAGASSPELLAALIGLFITHTDVGVGTIVGSELFNMLAICGASALAAPRPLAIAWRPLLRECGFYALALALLGATLSDGRITWWQSVLLLASHGLYVAVCAYYDSHLVPVLCPVRAHGSALLGVADLHEALLLDAERLPGALDGGSADDGLSGGDEAEALPPPAQHDWHSSVELARARLGGYGVRHGGAHGLAYGAVRMHGFLLKKSRFYSKVRLASRQWQRRWFVITEQGAVLYAREPLTPLERMRALDLRHATRARPISAREIEVHTEARRYVLRCPPQLLACWLDHLIVVVADHTAARRQHGVPEVWSARAAGPAGPGAGAAVRGLGAGFADASARLDAARELADDDDDDEADADAAAAAEAAAELAIALEGMAAAERAGAEPVQLLPDTPDAADRLDGRAAAAAVGAGSVPPLPPRGAVAAARARSRARAARCARRSLGALLAPIQLAVRVSVPSVRRAPPDSWRVLAAVGASACWLAVSSLCMVRAAERIGAAAGLRDSVTGLTIGAIGTSVPNAISSIAVARDGLGTMAVCNALGSNVFNIFVGLGLPWFLQTVVVARGAAPLALDEEGATILSAVLLLTGFLAGFVVLLAALRFRIGRRVGCALLGIYATFLVLALWRGR